MKKYFLKTYGCQMNKSDSERIVAVCEKMGYKKTAVENQADLIILNTCSVRRSAEDRILGKLNNYKKLKQQNPDLKIIITGCSIKNNQLITKNKKSFDTVDLLLDIKDLSCLPEKLKGQKSFPHHDYLQISPKYKSKFIAYVPIMTGCENFCAYCIVPYVRGKEISRPRKEIIKEYKNLVKNKYKLIFLVGQNVNSFMPGDKKVFPKLLKELDRVPGDYWLSFVTSHPKDLSDDLIEVMANGRHIIPYLHLPIQSGDDNILSKMNRKYTVKHYKNLIQKIRKKIPGIAISTDVIVGFPGETKKQFENTRKVFKEIKFDMAYIAQFSPRPYTAASKMEDNVSKEEKKRREKELTRILKESALTRNKKLVGKTIYVLVEYQKNDTYLGKTNTFKTVKFESKGKNLTGKFIKVKIENAIPWGLYGRIKA